MENETLLSSLGAQRKHVLGALEGLNDEALRRRILPSGWTCLGLVRHLALDIERFWFRGIVAGEKAVIEESAVAIDDAWHVGSDVPPGVVLDLYCHEIDLSDTIISAADLDAAPAWWPPELFGDWRLRDVREVLLHVITETACHAGHLDAVRELIDGRSWLVVTE